MGIHAYVHHIQIQNLGGTPVDGEGITGSIQSPAETSAGLISLTWI